MPKYYFEYIEDGDYGPGLRMVNRPHFDPTGGMGVAHDCLEHFHDDAGNTEAELEALGAMIHVRGDYYFQRISVIQAIADTMSDIARYELRHFIPPPPSTKLHDDLKDRVPALIKAIHAHFHFKDELVPSWLSDSVSMNNVIAWINHGYKRAITRYYEAMRRGIHMPDFFKEVETTVNTQIKYGMFDGQVWVLDINPEEYMVTMCEKDLW